MATVFDVAAYILSKTGPITAMKLQKLLYYGQAWSLVWDDAPLFRARIEAWANGPVVPAVYAVHKGKFKVGSGLIGGHANALSEVERETVDVILRFYGKMPSQQLSDLTHAERPWLDARKGLGPGDRGNVEITHAAMAEYYGSL
jgi:uncharacterized phage-associated protein